MASFVSHWTNKSDIQYLEEWMGFQQKGILRQKWLNNFISHWWFSPEVRHVGVGGLMCCFAMTEGELLTLSSLNPHGIIQHPVTSCFCMLSCFQNPTQCDKWTVIGLINIKALPLLWHYAFITCLTSMACKHWHQTNSLSMK